MEIKSIVETSERVYDRETGNWEWEWFYTVTYADGSVAENLPWHNSFAGHTITRG